MGVPGALQGRRAKRKSNKSYHITLIRVNKWIEPSVRHMSLY